MATQCRGCTKIRSPRASASRTALESSQARSNSTPGALMRAPPGLTTPPSNRASSPLMIATATAATKPCSAATIAGTRGLISPILTAAAMISPTHNHSIVTVTRRTILLILWTRVACCRFRAIPTITGLNVVGQVSLRVFGDGVLWLETVGVKIQIPAAQAKTQAIAPMINALTIHATAATLPSESIVGYASLDNVGLQVREAT